MTRTITLILTFVILLFFLSGCSLEEKTQENSNPQDFNSSANAPSENSLQKEAESSVRLIRYSWDGWGTSTKTIDTDELVSRITNALINMKNTGLTEEKISDDPFEIGGGDYPVERGTMWIEWGERIYRLSPDLSQISLVETHFGKGNILEITDSLKKDINDAWYYAPYDYYLGTYKAGEEAVELKNIFEAESSVNISIKNITTEKSYDPKNTVSLEIISSKDQAVTVTLHCQQSSDNLTDGDAKTVELKKGVPASVELQFGGWPYSYWIYIKADNTLAEIKIEP